MDPLSLLAIVGLAFAGKKFSDEPSDTVEVSPAPRVIMNDSVNRVVNGYTGTYQKSDPIAGVLKPGKEIQGNFGEISTDGTKPVFGQPVYDLYNRQTISSKMNNLAPDEKQLVGPGLGVGANVASFGGYQQMFRVLPTNTNVQRHTQLPGKAGGPARLVKNGPDNLEKTVLTQDRPNRVITWEPAQGRAVVTGQESAAAQYVKGSQQTLKDQLVVRSDNDGLGNPQYTGFGAGHVIAPKDLRSVQRTSGPDIVGGAGRMNVRAGPDAALGGVTKQRAPPQSEYINHANGVFTQKYIVPEYTNFNPFKETVTPNQDLNLAKTQLQSNPFNHPLSA
jgi:hypothetical protein